MQYGLLTRPRSRRDGVPAETKLPEPLPWAWCVVAWCSSSCAMYYLLFAILGLVAIGGGR